MRWDSLFHDLESQLQAATTAQQESEIRDRTRSEQSRLTFVQRLVGQLGREVDITTRSGRSVAGTLTNVGAQWIAVSAESRSVVLPLTALQGIRGLGRAVGRPLEGVEAKLGLGAVLRVLSRGRVPVRVWLAGATTSHEGVIDRVGADFLELGSVAHGEERRAVLSREVLTVPFAAIDCIDHPAGG